MYRLIRPLLFAMEPEKAHGMALSMLDHVPAWCFRKPPEKPVKAMGLEFSHPVGLAAGFDKSGAHLKALSRLGFSSIEVGTVTPRPQDGNPRPRLFRLKRAGAIINRMGFNNPGVDVLVDNVRRSGYEGVLGINIGKNRDTSLQGAIGDYLECLRKVYPVASYVAVNISSPNTPGLRDLQQVGYFEALLDGLREEQLELSDRYKRWVPLVIKVSPDETNDSLVRMAHAVVDKGIQGIIATNTTASRVRLRGMKHAQETGGLSGRPLASRSTECVRVIRRAVGDALCIIGVGGIDSASACSEKLRAGASLVQVYTGLVYRGPALIRKLLQ